MASQFRSDAQPYFDRLNETYTNPNAYFQSPEAQARMKLETNKLMGIDAAGGRLSNPIDRDVKLQQFAAKDMDTYRRSIQDSIGRIYQPNAIAKLFDEAAQNDSAQWGDIASWLGGGGSGGNVLDDIKDVIDSGSDLWDVISGWWD
jgi:hypothetical protein